MPEISFNEDMGFTFLVMKLIFKKKDMKNDKLTVREELQIMGYYLTVRGGFRREENEIDA